MSLKMRKTVKLLYTCLILFIIINGIMVTPALAANTAVRGGLTRFGATVVKGLIVFAEIFVTGYFLIRLTLAGIQYFIATAATDKAASRNRIRWLLFCGALAISGMYLLSYLTGV